MKLVVPYLGSLQPADANLLRVADFLGIPGEALPLSDCGGHYADYLRTATSPSGTCFVIHPVTLGNWISEGSVPADVISFLTSHFPQLLVHGISTDPWSASIVAALSGGALLSPHAVAGEPRNYEIAAHSEDICGPFAGLSFGPVNSVDDCVFSSAASSSVRRLITIGGEAFMGSLRREHSEILIIGSGQVADLDAELGDAPVVEYFSRLLPHAMALRYFFGEVSWRPCSQSASVIIDDPLLQPSYGFLQFESLLDMAQSNNFQATIGFIPHNCRRSTARTVGVFQSSGGRLSLCFHGNDHTGAEFAVTDPALLNTMLDTAQARMALHTQRTGLSCDRVMVFPQGKFSVEAMGALQRHNFDAAVNTVHHPMQTRLTLTLAERAQPAVLRYADFPLFLRRKSVGTQKPEIAFNLFFGIPVLIVEHHEIFENPQPLLEAVARINAVAPEIFWCSVGIAVNRSLLRRRESDGSYRIRAYSGAAHVSNQSDSCQHIHIEWNHHGRGLMVNHVLRNGKPYSEFETGDLRTSLEVTVEPNSTNTFSLVHAAPALAPVRFGVRHKTRAFVRRRLSEIRDNYLSKNPSMLAAAKALQRRLGTRSA